MFGSRPRLITALCMLVALTPLAVAEPEPLPVRMPLDGSGIEVDLRQGRVDVTIDDTLEPSLAVDDMVRGDQTEGFVVLGLNGNAVTIDQPHGSDQQAPRLVVRVVMHASQHVKIRGSQLSVGVEAFGADNPKGERSPHGGVGDAVATSTPRQPDPQLDIAPSDSDVHVVGAHEVVLGGTRNRFAVEHVRGSVRAKLEHGVLTVEDQQGPVLLDLTDTDVRLTRVTAAINFRFTGGQLQVTDGDGTLEGIGWSGALLLERWAGQAHASGESLHIEARASGAAEGTLRVDGAEHDITLEDIVGAINLDLKSGRLTAERLQGPLNLNAGDSAQLQLKGLKAPAQLWLKDRATARVEGAEQRLSGQLEDARLDCEAVRDLDFRVNTGSLTARDVRGQAHVVATDADLDLDFADTPGFPELKLSGRTRARLTLREPCVVRTEGSAADVRERLRIVGCEQQSADGRAGAGPTVRRDNTKPPQYVTLKLDELAEVDVHSVVR